MMQPMMNEAARQAPHVMSEMMKPMVMGAGGYAAARVLTTNPALSFLLLGLIVQACRALYLSALIFGLVHGVSVILPVAIMVGVLTAVIFRRTGSIWPCFILHGVYNAINGVASAFGFTPMQ